MLGSLGPPISSWTHVSRLMVGARLSGGSIVAGPTSRSMLGVGCKSSRRTHGLADGGSRVKKRSSGA